MKEQFQEIERHMPILNSKYVKSIPLDMLEPFRSKAMTYYGRTLERLALHRGLTVKEALELIRAPDNMPVEQYYDGTLMAEVDLWRQCGEQGLPYHSKEEKIDYSDCVPMTFKGNIDHLKYFRLVRDVAEMEQNPRPFVLYFARNTAEAFSFENGSKVNRTMEIHPAYPSAPCNKIEQAVAEFFGNVRAEQRPLLPEPEQIVKRPIELKLLGWRLDWPASAGIGKQRWCGADGWKQKDRMVKLGAVAVELWGDPAKAPSSGPSPWPVLGKEYVHRPDEPFFVLLGRDPQAPGIVEHWAEVREVAEPGDWKIENARQLAKDMRVFKAANPNFGMATDAYLQAAQVWFTTFRDKPARLSEDVISRQLKTLYNEAAEQLPPKRKTVDLDTGRPNVAHPEAGLLAQVAANNPQHLDFALQLVGAQPCPDCNYVHTHCRCGEKPTHLVVSSIPPEWPKDHPVLTGKWQRP